MYRNRRTMNWANSESHWARIHLTNLSASYQGTTFGRAETKRSKRWALAPAKPGPAGAEAQVGVEPVAARLKTCPDTKRFMTWVMGSSRCRYGRSPTN